MKKTAAFLFVLLLVLACPFAFGEIPKDTAAIAEEPDVAPVGPVRLNTPVDIPDYGTFTLLSLEYMDVFEYYYSWTNFSMGNDRSGVEADYILLRFDMLNTTVTGQDYAGEITDVVVTYKDKFPYEGFACQYNYDEGESAQLYPRKSGVTNVIGPLYMGHYALVCVLPNAVVNDKTGPLTVSFKLGGREAVYKVR